MIHLGRHSYNYGVQRGTANDVHVGNFSSIAEGVIFDGGFLHPTNFVSTFPFSSIFTGNYGENPIVPKDIHIGNDVTIGEDSIIMGGLTIGDGAIIGARTIVTKNIETYAIMIGAPMRFSRYRLSEFQIEQLLKIKWWEWDSGKIFENRELLQSNNIDEFIKLHYDSNKS